MQLRTRSAAVAAALIALGVSAPAASASREPLNAYRVAPTQENKQRLVKAGYDMTEADHGSYLEVYGTAKQAAALRRDGLAPKLQGAANVAGLPGGGRAGGQRRDVQRLAPLRPRAGRRQGAVPRAL